MSVYGSEGPKPTAKERELIKKKNEHLTHYFKFLAYSMILLYTLNIHPLIFEIINIKHMFQNVSVFMLLNAWYFHL